MVRIGKKGVAKGEAGVGWLDLCKSLVVGSSGHSLTFELPLA